MTVRMVVANLAGQPAVVCQPLRPSLGQLVVVSHGAGQEWNYLTDLAQGTPQLKEMAHYLAHRGFTVVQPQLFDTSLGATSGFTWGNNASTTQMANVITAAQSLPGVSGGKCALVGVSMGNITNLNHRRRAGEASIAGLLGLTPGCNIDLYRGTDASPGLFYSQVNAAFGVANDAAWRAVRDTYEPAAITPTLSRPLALWTNSDDTLAPGGFADALVTGNPTYVSRTDLGTGGHTTNNVTGSAVHAWLSGLVW